MRAIDRIVNLVSSVRADGWYNSLTGFGTSRDRTTGSRFAADDRLLDTELTDLFHHNDMARKIVSIVPREMLRQGYTLTSSTPDAAETVAAKMKALRVNTKLRRAMTWGRLYGGCVVFVGADDGQPADTPLQVDNVRAVNFLDVYDRRRAWPEASYQSTRDPLFGEPEIFCLQSLQGGTSYVHQSRLLIFRGAETDDQTRAQMQGWDYSILQCLYDTLGLFDDSYRAARLMLSDASQAVFKMKGLIGMLAGGMKADLETRARLLDVTRSIARAVMLDADAGEEFTKVPTQFAGVPDVLVQACNRLSAGTDIPVKVLIGMSPAGLNATGDADIRLWYDLLKSDQENELSPLFGRLIRLCANGTGFRNAVVTHTFNSLWQETPQEQVNRRKTVAETDAIYIQNEVLAPEEIARNRFRDDGWSAETKIDLSTRVPLPGTPGGPAKLTPPGPLPPAPKPAPGA